MINLGGLCVYCEDNYFLDKIENKCLMVEEENLKKHCVSYDSLQNCEYCEGAYYIFEGVCTEVSVLINNCEEYNTDTYCDHCEKNHLLSMDLKKCDTKPNIQNCQIFNKMECSECDEGYLKNNNLYFEERFKYKEISERESILGWMMLYHYGINFNDREKICQEVEVYHCMEYESFDKCLVCQYGFFLTEEKICQAYPKPQILNCFIYSTATTCMECMQGYYLKSNKCEPVNAVENCSMYDARSTSSKCDECSADYFLSGTNCQPRVVSKGNLISNCDIKKIKEDKCNVCVNGSILNSSETKCFTAVPDCLEHNSISDSAETATCKECTNGFFLNNDVCESGNVENCLKYSSLTSCKECINQYFLSSSTTCTKSNTLNNCEIYDGSASDKPNSCKVCTNNTFNFKISKLCKDVDAVENCLTYDNTAEDSFCLFCERGYFLDNETSCTEFDDSNCAEGSALNNCSECNAGFSLDLSGDEPACRTHHEYMIENCAKHLGEEDNNLQLKSVTCSYCKPNHFPLDYINGYVCVKEDYLEIEGILEADQISNCSKYKEGKCVECEESYFLKDNEGNLSCVQECEGTFELRKIEVADSNVGFHITGVNKCLLREDLTDKCTVTAPKIYIDENNSPIYDNEDNIIDNHICIKCHDDYLQVLDNPFFSNVDPEAIGFLSFVPDPLAMFPEVYCEQPSRLNENEDLESVPNCAYYRQVDPNEFVCIRCEFGYHGKVKGTENYYIDECVQMSACDNSIHLYGKHHYFQDYFSCDKCLDDNKIPFLGVIVTVENLTLIKLRPFDFDDSNYPDLVEGKEEESIQCMNPSSPTSFGDGTKFTQFPDFCGIGVINLSSTDGDNTDNKSIAAEVTGKNLATFCGACKPGYSPTYLHTNAKHVVVECTSINKCSQNDQKYFNKCSQCESGYVFEYNAGVIDYTSCIQHASDNCYAASPHENEKDGVCNMCKKGFILNKDLRCEKILAPKCATSNDSIIPKAKFIKNEYNYNLYYSPQGIGCNKCEAGYKAVFAEETKIVCTASPYITQNYNNYPGKSDETDTLYINYCEGYQNDTDVLKCQSCSTGYIYNEDYTKCISKVINCLTASKDNEEHCVLCEPGFALVDNACISGNILNCESYFGDENKSLVQCKKCSEGYSLDTNKTLCTEGYVSNCKEYAENSTVKCDTCNKGYSKIEKTVDICYPIDPSLNCEEVSLGTSVTCTSCALPNQVFSSPDEGLGTKEDLTICMSFTTISNCETYDIGDDINSTTFLCSKCQNDYFYQDYKCLPRQKIIPFCALYNPTEDKCGECTSGHYLMNADEKCEAFPIGIINCDKYTDQNTCVLCKGNSILVDNNCVEVTQTIENCIAYNGENSCKTCANGFVLTSNQCNQANVHNCKTYSSVDACATCPDKYGLKTEDGKTNCVAVNKANCVHFEPSGNFPCSICDKNYYPNAQGDCILASPLIIGCDHYESNDYCIRCAKGIVLSEDKKKCLDDPNALYFLDPNCQDAELSKNYQCAACLPGFYFKDDNCTSCTENTMTDGCFSCDPHNNSVCFICTQGYYQDKEGKCHALSGGDNNVTSDEEDGSRIMMIIMLMVSFLIYV